MKKQSKMTGPTVLTIIRMVLSVAFLVFALLPDMWAKITALSLFVVASITDNIDGRWARSKKITTDLGAFLDPLADKMLVDLAFLVLVYTNVVPLWMFAVIIVRDLAVDGMRMMAARDGVTIAASIFGKIKTTMQMIALISILANQIFDCQMLAVVNTILLYIVVILTIYSGADYLIKGWKKVIK